MGEVIDFPGSGEKGVKMAINYFRKTYSSAGLTESEIETAMKELEPIIRQFLVRKVFEFSLNGPFDQEQIDVIEKSHNEAMQNAIRYFDEQIWIALCIIGGLIGRDVLSA